MSFSIFSIACFLAIFQDLQCEFLIFLVGEFYRHIPGSTVGISHFSRFSLFLAIFQAIQCFCLIFQVFQFSHQNPGPTVCITHTSSFSLFPYSKSYSVCVSFSPFLIFLATIQFLQCVFLIFKVFHCFLPYSMSYSVCFSFHIFFSVSRHISCPTM